MSFADFKISSKLALGFGAGIVLLAIVSTLSFKNMSTMNLEIDDLVNDRFTKVELANSINNNINIIARGLRNILLEKDREMIAKESERIVDARKAMKDDLDKLEPLTHSEKGKALIKNVLDTRTQYVAAEENVLKLVADGKRDEAVDYMLTTVRKVQATYLEDVDKMVVLQTEDMRETGKNASEQVASALTKIVILGLIALLVSVTVGYFITRSLTVSLKQAVDVSNKLAAGDLNGTITVGGKDEVGQLLTAMQNMQGSLRGIISDDVGRVLEALSRGDLSEKISNDYPGVFGQLKNDANTTVEQLAEIIAKVKDSTDVITTASQEIAQGNADLSQRTEEQASSLEETASSMEELTSTVRQNAENAKQANQLSMNASDIAVKGGQVVNDVVGTMASISTSSKKIVDIISVIEGIAFQTNILALNAAVEAARAGEQGRGFAVVAGEVRNLAQRSASAAKEIKVLIDDSVNKVDAGTKQVDQAGATMNEIVTAVKRVTDIMSEITAASNEQSAGIEQVNIAIVQMDTVTQQNAALVEEAAAAAESMMEQTNVLDAAMNIFKLDEHTQGARTAVAKHVAKPIAKPIAYASPSAVNKKVGKRPIGKANAKTHETLDGNWKEF